MYHLGPCFYTQSRFPEAEQMYLQVLALKPDNIKAEENLGLTLEKEVRIQEAEVALRRAADWAAQQKSDEWPFLNLGNFMLDQGRFDEALAHLKRAASLAPRQRRCARKARSGAAPCRAIYNLGCRSLSARLVLTRPTPAYISNWAVLITMRARPTKQRQNSQAASRCMVPIVRIEDCCTSKDKSRIPTPKPHRNARKPRQGPVYSDSPGGAAANRRIQGDAEETWRRRGVRSSTSLFWPVANNGPNKLDGWIIPAPSTVISSRGVPKAIRRQRGIDRRLCPFDARDG